MLLATQLAPSLLPWAAVGTRQPSFYPTLLIHPPSSSSDTAPIPLLSWKASPSRGGKQSAPRSRTTLPGGAGAFPRRANAASFCKRSRTQGRAPLLRAAVHPALPIDDAGHAHVCLEIPASCCRYGSAGDQDPGRRINKSVHTHICKSGQLVICIKPLHLQSQCRGMLPARLQGNMASGKRPAGRRPRGVLVSTQRG